MRFTLHLQMLLRQLMDQWNCPTHNIEFWLQESFNKGLCLVAAFSWPDKYNNCSRRPTLSPSGASFLRYTQHFKKKKVFENVTLWLEFKLVKVLKHISLWLIHFEKNIPYKHLFLLLMDGKNVTVAEECNPIKKINFFFKVKIFCFCY